MLSVCKAIVSFFMIGFVLIAQSAIASDYHQYYEVTVTNITKGQIFTPILVASTKHRSQLFTLGEAASSELETLAESGNPTPLANQLVDTNKALDVATHDDVLLPGQSVTLKVKTNKKFSHVSVAAMLVPTNDAFFAVNSIHGPRGKRPITVLASAYDAGTENNDESCMTIPGPPFICQGEGVSSEQGEGFVHIHSGMHGIGDISAAQHDWRGQVAKITIQRVHH
mgnify:CR=1 FL=1